MSYYNIINLVGRHKHVISASQEIFDHVTRKSCVDNQSEKL